ncbi:MAG TPA: hypothetical protein PKN13_11030 [Accumulibacter sp.]|nr:hypothetical protein [Accumulibacter sp.]HMX23247.1 hypothetical protein [Accumulibacter sp.]HND80814.1 hypothetical protein [Accumulibacter sp.]HNE13397.1 hypothetical protein [Accumulibacter sp.]HNH23413.1 hypothetical protein [Accumulibacter sp.]
MPALVLIHGIDQQQWSADALEARWLPALAGGVRNAGYPAIADRLQLARGLPQRIEARMAFYGDLFLDPGAQGSAGDTPLTDEQEALCEALARAWLEEAAERATMPATRRLAVQELQALRGAAAGEQAQGAGNVLRRAIDSLSRVPGLSEVGFAVASRFFARALSQVSRYLTDDTVRQTVQARVAACVDDETRLLIGHSLGSVVAYEAAHALFPSRPLPLLITLGSPLGLRRIVHERLRPPPGFPPRLRRWVNVADRDDYIAAQSDLGPLFGHDRPADAVFESGMRVDNQRDAHGAERYLGKIEVGRPIGQTLDADA